MNYAGQIVSNAIFVANKIVLRIRKEFFETFIVCSLSIAKWIQSLRRHRSASVEASGACEESHVATLTPLGITALSPSLLLQSHYHSKLIT